MESEALRKEIHQYIDQADERVLKLMYGMIKADQAENLSIPEFHQEIISERLEKYQAKPDDVLSWQEVRNRIQKRK